MQNDPQTREELLEELQAARRQIDALTAEMQATCEAFQDLCFLLKTDGTILSYRAASSGELFVPPERFLGQQIQDVLPVGVAEQWAGAINKVKQSGSPAKLEYALLVPDGERIYKARLLPFGDEQILAVVRNITQARQAEEGRRAIEEMYRNVYDTAPLAFVVWDKRCRVTAWNRQAEETFGWSKQEAIGRDFFELIVPESARRHVGSVVKDLLRGKMASHSVNDNITKDGKTILCEWNNSVLHDKHGRVIGAISLGMKVTQRMRTELDQAMDEQEHHNID